MTFVKSIPSPPPDFSRYFHGAIGSEEATQKLKGEEDGSYLVRLSGAGDGLVISIVRGGKVYHTRVGKQEKGFFFETDMKIFPSLVQLIKANAKDCQFLRPFGTGSPYAELFDSPTAQEPASEGYYVGVQQLAGVKRK